MLGLVFAVVWLVICGAWIVVSNSGAVEAAKGRHGLDEADTKRVLAHPAFLLGLGFAPFWFVFGSNCFVTVPPAHVAAIYDPMRGGIQRTVLAEGFHVVLPWWQTQVFSQQTQEYTMSGTHNEGAVQGDDSIRCQTNEGMNVKIDCTVLYHVSPNEAYNLWQRIGEDYAKVIVRPVTQNVMRMIVARYSVEDVYTGKRKEVESEIAEAMRPAFAEKGLVLEQMLVRGVQYGNPAFADAISAKQVAQQQVQTEHAKLSRARVEKDTIIATASGEASAIEKRGATLRQNPEVVQYEFVQKVAPRLKRMYLPAGSLPVLSGGGK